MCYGKADARAKKPESAFFDSFKDEHMYMDTHSKKNATKTTHGSETHTMDDLLSVKIIDSIDNVMKKSKTKDMSREIT